MKEAKNVWQLLDEKHWQYLPFWDGYQSPDGKFFLTNSSLYRLPGDIIYFLETGIARTPDIFDTGMFKPNPKDLGFRQHKDGRCVAIRKLK